MRYVAVGFRVNTSRSIFYIKDSSIDEFLVKLKHQIHLKDPDFVSLRTVRDTE